MRRPTKGIIALLCCGIGFLFHGTPADAQLANGKCKFLGNIIGGPLPSDFKDYWNQVSPENAGKWKSVEAERDVMVWDELDNAYNFALTNDFPFKQHTFVWGQQQPAWIGALSPEEQKQEVEEWIQAFCEKYPETDFIDVVNEPLHAPPDYAAALGGSGTTGWDWVIWSFEKARQYCPNAKLILNDYNIVSSNSATNNYLQIINLLKERNLIDIIGEQGHFLETTSLNTIKQNLDKLSATGLPIHISEFDIDLADDNAQVDKYKDLFPLLWEHPGVRGITLWGYRQGLIWRENAYLVRSDNTARPALTWLSEYVTANKGGSFCNPVTGISEAPSPIEIYPNPAPQGNFTLELGEGKFEVKVFDLHGMVKKELQVTGNQSVAVQIPEAPGIYLLRIFDGYHTITKKIILY